MNYFAQEKDLKTDSGSHASIIDIYQNSSLSNLADYDIVAIGESIPLEKVSKIGICTHAGFRIPNQKDVIKVLELFPNLEEVEYNVIDARIKDKSYWTDRVTDLGSTSNPRLKYGTIFFGDAYLSKIPLFKEYFEEIKLKYIEAFKELAKEEPQIIVFDGDLERGEHAYLDKEKMQMLKERANKRKEGKYYDADEIKSKLNGSQFEIIEENRNNSRTVLKDYRIFNEQKREFFDVLENVGDVSSVAELQAAVHEGVFRNTIQKYNSKRDKKVSFKRINFIPEETLTENGYNHILEDHFGQQAVLLPVLQGDGNGETEKHRIYVHNKYAKALEESNAPHDLPHIIISPKKSKSMFG